MYDRELDDIANGNFEHDEVQREADESVTESSDSHVIESMPWWARLFSQWMGWP